VGPNLFLARYVVLVALGFIAVAAPHRGFAGDDLDAQIESFLQSQAPGVRVSGKDVELVRLFVLADLSWDRLAVNDALIDSPSIAQDLHDLRSKYGVFDPLGDRAIVETARKNAGKAKVLLHLVDHTRGHVQDLVWGLLPCSFQQGGRSYTMYSALRLVSPPSLSLPLFPFLPSPKGTPIAVMFSMLAERDSAYEIHNPFTGPNEMNLAGGTVSVIESREGALLVLSTGAVFRLVIPEGKLRVEAGVDRAGLLHEVGKSNSWSHVLCVTQSDGKILGWVETATRENEEKGGTVRHVPLERRENLIPQRLRGLPDNRMIGTPTRDLAVVWDMASNEVKRINGYGKSERAGVLLDQDDYVDYVNADRFARAREKFSTHFIWKLAEDDSREQVATYTRRSILGLISGVLIGDRILAAYPSAKESCIKLVSLDATGRKVATIKAREGFIANSFSLVSVHERPMLAVVEESAEHKTGRLAIYSDLAVAVGKPTVTVDFTLSDGIAYWFSTDSDGATVVCHTPRFPKRLPYAKVKSVLIQLATGEADRSKEERKGDSHSP
jgi:phosphopantetheinyl transferase (holo-ACP synthase)